MAEAEQYGEGCYRWWLLEMETGNNGAAIMQDKILRYQRLRAEMKRKLIFGWACPQVIIVVRNNSQIPRQIELWRKHCNVAMPGAVLVTSLEGLYKSFQAGRAALLNLKCLVDPLTSREPRYLTYPEALALSVAISD